MNRPLRLEGLSKGPPRKRAGLVILALVALLAGCRSVPDYSASGEASPDLDAEIARAAGLQRPILVLVAESGQSHADDHARTLFQTLPAENNGIVFILLDLGISRNRAEAARFHITDTPVLLCLSPRGLIVSRDAEPITHALLTRRVGEVAQKGPELDAKLDLLAQAASQNPNDAQARFEMANFFLAQRNDHEAIPHLESVAHNEATDPPLRIRAWTALARAHLWIAEPEKARHEAQDLIAVLGPKMPEARAGGNLVLGLQDAANVKRIPLARHEFEEAIAAAPNSVYGKQAAEELAKLPGTPR
jgi:tetratricopeptide (TPR) repeat protein